VAKSTERSLPQGPQETGSKSASTLNDDSDDDVQCLDDEPEPVKVLESMAEFKDVVVWGHDQMPGHDDDFVKGVEEWIAFGDAIHGNDRP
jgi:ribonuclease H2 subunit C